jgi:glycosyltransferase involved in cell wall biosynthesis
MARIYIDARNITETPSGIARYAKSLIPELVDQNPEHRFKVIRHTSNRTDYFSERTNLDEIFAEQHIDNAANYLLGTRTLDPVFREHGQPDLYHSLFHIVPRGLRRQRYQFPIATTLHDLVWIDHPHQSQQTWAEAVAIKQFASRAIPETLDIADGIITVSDPTQKRAKEWIEPAKMKTIHHGVESPFFEISSPDDPPLDGLDSAAPVVTAVGNDKPYKNLKRLITAFSWVQQKRPDSQLVLIGGCDGLEPAIEALQLPNSSVHLPGFVPETKLRDILGSTDLFVFPSLIEGFGLPIIEAMAAGIPVITSDRQPMKSVAGDAARLVDPTDTVAMAAEITQILSSEAIQEELAERSREHADRFRWGRAAEETSELYRDLLGIPG